MKQDLSGGSVGLAAGAGERIKQKFRKLRLNRF